MLDPILVHELVNPHGSILAKFSISDFDGATELRDSDKGATLKGTEAMRDRRQLAINNLGDF